jgi:hypothetical protein
MKERTTQLLLAAVAVLLAVHLLRPGPGPSARGGEAGQGAAGAPAPANTQAPAVLRAQSFEMVNGRGQVIAQLHPGEDGGGNLRLRTGDGTIRVKLGAGADGSSLLLMDSQPEPAVWLASGKSGTSITLAEKGKEKRVLEP